MPRHDELINGSAHREVSMATYVSLVNFTDEGARHIRHTTERAKGLVNAAAKLGIKVRDIYWFC